jgi:hypothetical protein
LTLTTALFIILLFVHALHIFRFRNEGLIS